MSGVSALLRGGGWDLPDPTWLISPSERWGVPADEPGGLAALLERLDEVATSGDPDLVAAGFVTYEAGVALEGSAALFRPPVRTPLAAFGLFRLSESTARPLPGPHAGVAAPVLEEATSRNGWTASVETIREGIARGDVYQVNLTRRLTVRGAGVEALPLAAALFAENPVPYAVAFDAGPYAVVSNSPELFLDIDFSRGTVESRPIKGTVARGEDAAADDAAIRRLLASDKDAAEHLMIVDLIRNDLGRVSVPGGVRVPRFRTLLSFRHLHHLESTVAGRLGPGVTLSSILRATLPGGSISGAPKHASLRFIRDLEPCARGPYTGAAGYVRGNGRAVFNVAIRTAIVSGAGVDYHAGGGIVWDSDPAAEWDETETKSREFGAVLRGRMEAPWPARV